MTTSLRTRIERLEAQATMAAPRGILDKATEALFRNIEAALPPHEAYAGFAALTKLPAALDGPDPEGEYQDWLKTLLEIERRAITKMRAIIEDWEAGHGGASGSH